MLRYLDSFDLDFDIKLFLFLRIHSNKSIFCTWYNHPIKKYFRTYVGIASQSVANSDMTCPQTMIYSNGRIYYSIENLGSRPQGKHSGHVLVGFRAVACAVVPTT